MRQARRRRRRRADVFLGHRICKFEGLESLGMRVSTFLAVFLLKYIWSSPLI